MAETLLVALAALAGVVILLVVSVHGKARAYAVPAHFNHREPDQRGSDER